MATAVELNGNADISFEFSEMLARLKAKGRFGDLQAMVTTLQGVAQEAATRMYVLGMEVGAAK